LPLSSRVHVTTVAVVLRSAATTIEARKVARGSAERCGSRRRGYPLNTARSQQ
jgi:hypothetical protein